MRSRYGIMLGLASIAAASVGAIMTAAPILDRKQTKRDEEVSPHGPEVSRQVRRRIERQQMKKGTRR